MCRSRHKGALTDALGSGPFHRSSLENYFEALYIFLGESLPFVPFYCLSHTSCENISSFVPEHTLLKYLSQFPISSKLSISPSPQHFQLHSGPHVYHRFHGPSLPNMCWRLQLYGTVQSYQSISNLSPFTALIFQSPWLPPIRILSSCQGSLKMLFSGKLFFPFPSLDLIQ